MRATRRRTVSCLILAIFGATAGAAVLDAASLKVAAQIEVEMLRAFAVPGGSGPSANAALLVSVSRADTGAALTGLGNAVGDGTAVITLPTGWALQTLARPLGDTGCALQPTLFVELGNGVYSLRVSPGACPWRPGGYAVGLQLQITRPGLVFAGTGQATLALTGFDDGLLTNGGFDSSADGWPSGSFVTTTWIGEDAEGRAGSGAAAVTIGEGIVCGSLRQCVAVGSGNYEVAARFRPPASGRQGLGLVGLLWYASPNCTGSPLNTTEPPIPPPAPGGVWTRRTWVEHSLPGAQSVKAELAICKADSSTDGTVRVDVDTASLQRIGESSDVAATGEWEWSASPNTDEVMNDAASEAGPEVALRVQVQALPTNASNLGLGPSSYAWLLVTVNRADDGKPLFNLGNNVGNGSATIQLPQGWALSSYLSPGGVPGCQVAPTAFRNLRQGARGTYLIQVVPSVPSCSWYRGSYGLGVRVTATQGNTTLRGGDIVQLAVP